MFFTRYNSNTDRGKITDNQKYKHGTSRKRTITVCAEAIMEVEAISGCTAWKVTPPECVRAA